MNAFLEGMVAGFGIAVPVGAIAILIIDTALQRGIWGGLPAAAGAASADLLYAALAALSGELLADILQPINVPLRTASGFLLLAIGGRGLWQIRAVSKRELRLASGRLPIYAQFLALTLLNPLTITYFAALILGGSAGTLGTAGSRLLFVLGAGLASLSWQVFLALLGALGRARLSRPVQILTRLVGNLVVMALGLRIVLGHLSVWAG